MYLFLVLSLTFLMASCSTMNMNKESQVQVVENTCYVKWKNYEMKEVYYKSIGKTREEKLAQNLLIPSGQNGGFYVRSKLLDDTYSVVFDPSDQHGVNIVDRMADQYFTEIDPKLKNDIRWSSFKISSQEVNKMVELYEPVDCQEYMASQIMQ